MLKTSTAEQLSVYVHSIHATSDDASEVLKSITPELLARDGMVSNKTIILALLEKLEIEPDVLKCDIYRNVLKTIIQKTPKDL